MLSPEENVENKVRSSNDSDIKYSTYLKSAKHLHRFQLLVLAICGIQFFTFFSLAYDWYSDFTFQYIVRLSLQWEIPYTIAILYVKLIQLLAVIVTFRILKRLKNVLFNENVDLKEIDKLHIIQLSLILAIPNLLNFCFFLVILLLRARMKFLYRTT